MFPDEVTFRALLAASAAERQGFHGTAEAFLALARGSILDALTVQPWIDRHPWTTDHLSGPEHEQASDGDSLVAQYARGRAKLTDMTQRRPVDKPANLPVLPGNQHGASLRQMRTVWPSSFR